MPFKIYKIFRSIFRLTLTEPISSVYDVVSRLLNFLLNSLDSESMSITFCTNAFCSDILTARFATAFEAKINFGRDKLMA